MTKKEYTQYEADFAEFMSHGLNNLSTKSECNEPYFSNSPCVVCGALPGGRYDCDGYNGQTQEVEEYEGVCQDCVYYAEYGRLDDTTMMEIDGE